MMSELSSEVRTPGWPPTWEERARKESEDAAGMASAMIGFGTDAREQKWKGGVKLARDTEEWRGLPITLGVSMREVR